MSVNLNNSALGDNEEIYCPPTPEHRIYNSENSFLPDDDSDGVYYGTYCDYPDDYSGYDNYSDEDG